MKKYEMNDLRSGVEGGDRRGITGRIRLEKRRASLCFQGNVPSGVCQLCVLEKLLYGFTPQKSPF